MTKWTDISTSVQSGVATITFDRLERRNALSLGLLSELSDQLDEWATDDDVAAVVITAGEEFFCAGLDLDLQSGRGDLAPRRPGRHQRRVPQN